MKRIAIVLVLVLLAASAQAQTIYDMRTDLVAQNTPVQVSNLIVTGFYYNGVFVSEAPHGEFNSIWIYIGSGAAVYPAQGDVIQVQGLFKIYNGWNDTPCGNNIVTRNNRVATGNRMNNWYCPNITN